MPELNPECHFSFSLDVLCDEGCGRQALPTGWVAEMGSHLELLWELVPKEPMAGPTALTRSCPVCPDWHPSYRRTAPALSSDLQGVLANEFPVALSPSAPGRSEEMEPSAAQALQLPAPSPSPASLAPLGPFSSHPPSGTFPHQGVSTAALKPQRDARERETWA